MKENINGAKIIGGNGERIDSDFYPTPKDVTIALMEFLKSVDSPLFNLFWSIGHPSIWEPACGDGAISDVLKDYFPRVISSDLRETGYQDFIFDFANGDQKTQYDAIITNPPFNLAETFIRRSLKQTNHVALLLKTQYWHASKRTKLFKDHPPAYVLPLNWRPNFFGEKATGSPTMDFIWCVWMAGQSDTRYRILEKPVEEKKQLSLL